MEGVPWREQTLRSIVSLNSLAQLYNSRMCNSWEVREDRFQGLGHHCQSGTEAEAEPLPTVLNAMPTGRSPSSLLTFPTPLVSQWKWAGFVTTKFPGAALTLRKQGSLSLSKRTPFLTK